MFFDDSFALTMGKIPLPAANPGNVFTKIYCFIAVCLLAFIAGVTVTYGEPGYVWKSELPLPDTDPLWEEVGKLWKNHWDGKNMDDILSRLHALEKKYPGTIEPYLWLGKSYYIKGRFFPNKRNTYNKIAEDYALKAHRIDDKNFFALFILLHSLSNCEDFSYIEKHYGDWIRRMAPLPTGRLIPDMDGVAGWDAANYYWQHKEVPKNLVLATENFESIARKHPELFLAQLWAGFACYNLGEYYSVMGAHDEKGLPLYESAISYCEKALKLEPYSYQAHFWYQFSLSRKIQDASLFTKARYLKPLMNHLLFCVQENALYSSCGPVYVLATMIVHGGWVCEKGMEMQGYTTDMVITMLYVAEILYPDVNYIPFINAVLLEREKRDREALAIIDRQIKKGPPKEDDPEKTLKQLNYENLIKFQEQLLSKKENRKFF